MERMILGIDPGKNGGFCIMFPDRTIEYFKSPVIGKEIDEGGYTDIIETAQRMAHIGKHELYAFLEDVHAIHGSAAKATFEFGRAVGLLQGILKAHRIPTVLVKPKQWQAKAWSGVKIQKKQDGIRFKTDTKSTSLMAAKRLFPQESFLATSRSKVPHDGIVDATLIAYFGRDHYFSN